MINYDIEGDCDNCGFHTMLHEFDAPQGFARHSREEKHLLCELCSGTFWSHALQYPGQQDSKLFKCLAYSFNMVLAAIREQPSHSPSEKETK